MQPTTGLSGPKNKLNLFRWLKLGCMSCTRMQLFYVHSLQIQRFVSNRFILYFLFFYVFVFMFRYCILFQYSLESVACIKLVLHCLSGAPRGQCFTAHRPTFFGHFFGYVSACMFSLKGFFANISILLIVTLRYYVTCVFPILENTNIIRFLIVTQTASFALHRTHLSSCKRAPAPRGSDSSAQSWTEPRLAERQLEGGGARRRSISIPICTDKSGAVLTWCLTQQPKNKKAGGKGEEEAPWTQRARHEGRPRGREI